MCAAQARPKPRRREPSVRSPKSRPPAKRPFPRWAHLALAVAITGLSLGLRIHDLGHESFWVDEAITYGRATKAPAALIQDTLGRKHIPTYFLFMHHWLEVGDSEFALRLPSALFGTVTCGLSYAIGALAAGPVAGIAAGLLMAVAPAQLHYAQEARMYALLTMVAALALLGLMLLVRAPMERGRFLLSLSPRVAPERRTLVGWMCLALGTTGILWTHNTAIFFVASLQLAALWVALASPGRRLIFACNWTLIMGICLAAWSPWIPHLIDQSGSFNRWKQRPLSTKLARDVFEQLLLVGDPEAVLTWLLAAVALWAIVATARTRGPTRTATWALCAALLAGFGLSIAASLLKANMFFVRTLLWTAIVAYGLVGVGLAHMPRGAGLAVLAVILALTLPHTGRYYSITHKPRWRDFLQQLADKTDEGDIILGVRVTRFTYYYYHRRDGRLPSRQMHHVGRQQRLQDIVGDADHFWVLAKRSAGRMKHFKYLLRKSKRRYHRVRYQRAGDALLMEYDVNPEQAPRRPLREAFMDLQRKKAADKARDKKAKPVPKKQEPDAK